MIKANIIEEKFKIESCGHSASGTRDPFYYDKLNAFYYEQT